MRRLRVQFTIRRLMVAIFGVAVVLEFGFFVQQRDFTPGILMVYSVADLIGPSVPASQVPAELDRVASRLRASVTPDVWWSPRRSVTPFLLSRSLIVEHSGVGHSKVVSWIHEQRADRGSGEK